MERWEKSIWLLFDEYTFQVVPSFYSNLIFSRFHPHIFFNSTDYTCCNFVMMGATKSRKDFNEWCLPWLIKIGLIFSVDKTLEYQLLAQLDSFNFLPLFCKGGLCTLINGTDYTGEVSTRAWRNSTWVTFFLFSNGSLWLPSPRFKNNLHSISSHLMRARFQNSYHEHLMTIKCNIKDHPQLK